MKPCPFYPSGLRIEESVARYLQQSATADRHEPPEALAASSRRCSPWPALSSVGNSSTISRPLPSGAGARTFASVHEPPILNCQWIAGTTGAPIGLLSRWAISSLIHNARLSGGCAMDHTFKVGQLVRPREKLLENTGIFEIIRLLPPGLDDEPLYRLKAANGPIYRVMREADITPASVSSERSG
jgi:hypothetical protein